MMFIPFLLPLPIKFLSLSSHLVDQILMQLQPFQIGIPVHDIMVVHILSFPPGKLLIHQEDDLYSLGSIRMCTDQQSSNKQCLHHDDKQSINRYIPLDIQCEDGHDACNQEMRTNTICSAGGL